MKPSHLDTGLYVAGAMIIAAQGLPDLPRWLVGCLAVVGAGVVAWKAKRSTGIAESPKQPSDETLGP